MYKTTQGAWISASNQTGKLLRFEMMGLRGYFVTRVKRGNWIKLGHVWFYEAECVSMIDLERDKAKMQRCFVIF